MATFLKLKENFNFIVIGKLIIVSLLIGILSSFLALSLKHSTEYFENAFCEAR